MKPLILKVCFLLHLTLYSLLYIRKRHKLYPLLFFVWNIEEMLHGLGQLSWERVDVSFHNSKQRYVAHNTIQVSLIIGVLLTQWCVFLNSILTEWYWNVCRWRHIGYILMVKMSSFTWWIISVSSPQTFSSNCSLTLQLSQQCKKVDKDYKLLSFFLFGLVICIIWCLHYISWLSSCALTFVVIWNVLYSVRTMNLYRSSRSFVKLFEFSSYSWLLLIYNPWWRMDLGLVTLEG